MPCISTPCYRYNEGVFSVLLVALRLDDSNVKMTLYCDQHNIA